MNGWGLGGIAGAALALIVLEVLVTSQNNPGSGASNLPGLLAEPGKLAAAWMNPAVPLVPDRSAASSSTSSASSSSAPPPTGTTPTPSNPGTSPVLVHAK